MTTLLLYDPEFLNHDPGPTHPERPARLEAVVSRLTDLPRGARMRAPARPATAAELERVHDPAFVGSLLALRGKNAVLDADTFVSPGSVDAALLAAGACIEIVDEVIAGKVKNGFAIVRPPGHHAEAAKAMGFCLFNNVAVAAAAALTRGISRVLIVDWDVHHGNGTQAIFYERRDVLFFSTHQYPLYPGTGSVLEKGAREGAGYTVNVPLRADLGDADYMLAFNEVLIPAADAYRPELVLVSAGFDAHDDDPLAAMHMTRDGFGALTAVVCDIAEKWAGGRVVLTLEGGYALGALAASVRACVDVLAGAPAPDVTGAASEAGREDVREAASAMQLVT